MLVFVACCPCWPGCAVSLIPARCRDFPQPCCGYPAALRCLCCRNCPVRARTPCWLRPAGQPRPAQPSWSPRLQKLESARSEEVSAGSLTIGLNEGRRDRVVKYLQNHPKNSTPSLAAAGGWVFGYMAPGLESCRWPPCCWPAGAVLGECLGARVMAAAETASQKQVSELAGACWAKRSAFCRLVARAYAAEPGCKQRFEQEIDLHRVPAFYRTLKLAAPANTPLVGCIERRISRLLLIGRLAGIQAEASTAGFRLLCGPADG